MPYQAIRTRYAGPTNHRGARVIATCDAGRAVIPWPHELSGVDCHAEGAMHLAHRLGWSGPWTAGALADGGYAFVMVPRPNGLPSRDIWHPKQSVHV